MTRPQKSVAQLLAKADELDRAYGERNRFGPRANRVWWDRVMLPALQRRWRLARAGRVVMRKAVHDEMHLRDLLAKAQAAAARGTILVVRRSQPGGQRPALVPTDEELRTAARRRARLALS